MITISSTVTEAFHRGVHIAKVADGEDQIVTILNPEPGRGNLWRLSNSEWAAILAGVRALSRFLANVFPMPLQVPSEDSLATLMSRGHGVRFWFRDEGENAEEMQYDTLAFCVRNLPQYGFADGDTIADASSHSPAELWWDVILPAIRRGEIEVTVWGDPL